MNSVRLYSNGTAVICRGYSVEKDEPLAITIPVRKSDLDDVVSSLGIFGDVTVTSPPTYVPTNAEETALSLNPNQALEEFATKLAGADVEIQAGSSYRGKLVGRQRHRREINGTVAEEPRIIVLTEKGVQQIAESSITSLQFTDPVIQEEIDKALRASVAEITPDRSQIEFAIQCDSPTEAVVTYATPVAAWKIRYQLRLSPEGTELDGQAIVDNDTDDDWTDTQITVITGEPITFSTDLAELRRPWRKRMNLVADEAAGAVEAAPPMSAGMSGDSMYADSMLMESPEETDGGDLRMMIDGGAYLPARRKPAESRRSGDFNSFTAADPVTIKSKQSAIVPLFRIAVEEAKPLLFYNERDDARRPYRAVRITNPADHALGRGVCEVFVEGDFQGKAILDSTPPGEEALLVHARDTGVEVDKEFHPRKTRRLAIEIAAGVVKFEQSGLVKTVYWIRNRHADDFTFECDHERVWTDSTIEVEATGTGAPDQKPEEMKTRDGCRFRFTLPARGLVQLTVVEERIESESFSLEFSWLRSNVIGSNKKLKTFGPEMRRCAEANGRVESLQGEIKDHEKMVKTLSAEQDRLMKLIPNGHAEQANLWRSDLAEAESEIREINRVKVPQLKEQLKAAKKELAAALANLEYSWRNGQVNRGSSSRS